MIANSTIEAILSHLRDNWLLVRNEWLAAMERRLRSETYIPLSRFSKLWKWMVQNTSFAALETYGILDKDTKGVPGGYRPHRINLSKLVRLAYHQKIQPPFHEVFVERFKFLGGI